MKIFFKFFSQEKALPLAVDNSVDNVDNPENRAFDRKVARVHAGGSLDR
jgi:hypothetical protein